MAEIKEITNIRDLFSLEEIHPDIKAEYLTDFVEPDTENTGDYTSVLRAKESPRKTMFADFVEVPFSMNDLATMDAELENFVETLRANHKEYGIKEVDIRLAKRRLVGTWLQYKDMLFREYSLVAPYRRDSYGIGLLTINSAVKLTSLT